jgi:hypothetical protein
MHRLTFAHLFAFGFLGGVAPLHAQSSAGIDFFEKKIRPVLVEHCYACHSESAKKTRGDLRLDTRDATRKGGQSGPAVVPGKIQDSLLLQAIRHTSPDLKMPPKGKLPDAVLADFEAWIRMGAPDPRDGKAASPASNILEVGRKHWAFQPLMKTVPPAVKATAWPNNDIDRFLLARLEAEKLQPVGDAPARTLIRRINLDLIGLPPSPEEIDAIERDKSANWYEKLVDRLLDRPEYGERWARHWLDVARYTDTAGFEGDRVRENVWRYRDYVIDAFNQDKPFHQFLIEHLAADEMASANPEVKVALTFLRLGPHDNYAANPELHRYDRFDDALSTVSQAFLAQTLACARCHDHKFEPYSQRDYYRFLAAFRPLMVNSENDGVPLVEGAGNENNNKKGKAGKPMAYIWLEKPGKILPTHVLKRGDPRQPMEEVTLGLPDVFAKELPPAPKPLPHSSGRRLWLANWMTTEAQALTARVLVNRLWQHHFGRGLVDTPNDFGLMGERPSHPALLDWLAADFLAGGWKIKRLQRMIVLSHAYRLASSPNAAASKVDPDNRLLWHWRSRRMEAEAFRDSVLSVSGKLDPERGGSGQESKSLRRSIYLLVKRAAPVPELEIMDGPDGNFSTAKRTVSTTPLQALTWMNGKFIQDQADALASRLRSETGDDPEALVRRAYQIVFCRTPGPEELQGCVTYLTGGQQGASRLTPQRLASLCLVLLNTNEFAYIN